MKYAKNYFHRRYDKIIWENIILFIESFCPCHFSEAMIVCHEFIKIKIFSQLWIFDEFQWEFDHVNLSIIILHWLLIIINILFFKYVVKDLKCLIRIIMIALIQYTVNWLQKQIS